MKLNSRRFLAALAVGALALAGVTLSATAASADEVNGTITLYGPGGTSAANQITSGSTADVPMYWGITVDGTCPAGFRDGTAVAAFQGGVFKGALSTVQTLGDSGFGNGGLTGGQINKSEQDIGGSPNIYVSDKELDVLDVPLADGPFELRYYCMAGASAFDPVGDKYYVLDLQKTGSTWSVYSAPVSEATTVSLTANAVVSSVTLEGTVKDSSNATAAAAAGSIEFYEGATLLDTVPVAAGIASKTLTGVANGLHSYTAKFVSSNTATFSSSALSGTATAIVGTNTQQSTITVTIGSNGGALVLSGVPASVPLGTATINGGPTGTFDATGNLSGVTVTDTRSLDFPAWSLTGQVADFSDGTHTLLGKYLGWTPSKVSGPASSVAGAAVLPAPATTDGISTSAKTLGTGTPDVAGTVSVFDAGLSLKAPGNTPAGSYSALLTITLA